MIRQNVRPYEKREQKAKTKVINLKVNDMIENNLESQSSKHKILKK